MKDEEWDVVHRASGMVNANIIVGRLETEGIPTRLRYEAVGTIYPITIDGLGEVQILVPAHYLDLAREVLARSYDNEDMNWDNDEA